MDSIKDENDNFELDRLRELYMFRMPRSFRYAGYVWPGVTLSVERMEFLNNFEFRPSDILVVSYPKSGTTWVSEIVSQLCHATENKQMPLHERVPWLEMENDYIWVRFYWLWQMFSKVINIGASVFHGTTNEDKKEKVEMKPRMWFSHLPLELMPRQVIEGKCKVIYVCRNPKDTAVSYYHFHRMARFLGQQKLSWDEFFRLYFSGNVYCGSWFEHVISYWKLSKLNSNLLFIKYEDMIKDLRSEIGRLDDFIGLNASPSLVDEVIENVKFKSMKENQKANRAGVWLFNQKVSEFIRKGEVGDWKNYFTPIQNEQFDSAYRAVISKVDIDFKFDIQ